jgi:hypothetical protein
MAKKKKPKGKAKAEARKSEDHGTEGEAVAARLQRMFDAQFLTEALALEVENALNDTAREKSQKINQAGPLKQVRYLIDKAGYTESELMRVINEHGANEGK